MGERQALSKQENFMVLGKQLSLQYVDTNAFLYADAFTHTQ